MRRRSSCGENSWLPRSEITLSCRVMVCDENGTRSRLGLRAGNCCGVRLLRLAVLILQQTIRFLGLSPLRKPAQNLENLRAAILSIWKPGFFSRVIQEKSSGSKCRSAGPGQPPDRGQPGARLPLHPSRPTPAWTGMLTHRVRSSRAFLISRQNQKNLKDTLSSLG
jgi:hypothetical protein